MWSELYLHQWTRQVEGEHFIKLIDEKVQWHKKIQSFGEKSTMNQKGRLQYWTENEIWVKWPSPYIVHKFH